MLPAPFLKSPLMEPSSLSPFLLVYTLLLNIESQFFPQTSLTFNVSQKVFLKKMSLSSVTLPFFKVITYPIYFFRIRNMFFFPERENEGICQFAIVVKMYPRTPASQKVPGITCQLYFHFKFLLLPTWEVADDGSRSHLCGPPRLVPSFCAGLSTTRHCGYPGSAECVIDLSNCLQANKAHHAI